MSGISPVHAGRSRALLQLAQSEAADGLIGVGLVQMKYTLSLSPLVLLGPDHLSTFVMMN